MEIVPQPNYCPVEPEEKTKENQPVGVVPPNMPNQAEISIKTDKSSKTSPLLFILVMILLIISSGLGYLIVTGNTEILNLIGESIQF